MRSISALMIKKLKSHFTKHFCVKFCEVLSEKNFVQLVKLQFVVNFLPFGFCQSLMKLTPGRKNFRSLAPGEVQDDELIPETRSSLVADPQVDQHLESVVDR
jgi:hypothetical protein